MSKRVKLDLLSPELQIVALFLKRHGFATVKEYKKSEESRGIIENFIKKEIEGFEKQEQKEIARIILRMMCTKEYEAKASEDVSIKSIQKEVKKTVRNSGRNSFAVVSSILVRFTEARIIVENRKGEYNLVHDYLAPLVWKASIEEETKKESANRLLKKYRTLWEDNSRIMIPLRDYMNIRRYASFEIKSEANSKKLLQKSLFKMYSKFLILPLSLLIALFLGSYAYLGQLYYLSTGQDLERIEVRRGIPGLDFLPPSGNLLLSTPFEVSDLMIDSGNFKYKLLREKIRGTIGKTKGMDRWLLDLFPQLSNEDQACILKTHQPQELLSHVKKEILANPILSDDLQFQVEARAANGKLLPLSTLPPLRFLELNPTIANIAYKVPRNQQSQWFGLIKKVILTRGEDITFERSEEFLIILIQNNPDLAKRVDKTLFEAILNLSLYKLALVITKIKVGQGHVDDYIFSLANDKFKKCVASDILDLMLLSNPQKTINIWSKLSSNEKFAILKSYNKGKKIVPPEFQKELVDLVLTRKYYLLPYMAMFAKFNAKYINKHFFVKIIRQFEEPENTDVGKAFFEFVMLMLKKRHSLSLKNEIFW